MSGELIKTIYISISRHPKRGLLFYVACLGVTFASNLMILPEIWYKKGFLIRLLYLIIILLYLNIILLYLNI